MVLMMSFTLGIHTGEGRAKGPERPLVAEPGAVAELVGVRLRGPDGGARVSSA